MRADNEVALAEANALTSRVSFGEATLHELVGKADDFLEGAEDAYELARDTVPMSKQAATRAKVYAYNTEKARKDAQGVISEMKKIAPSAASAAAETIMAQLKQESIAEAEKKGAADAANWAATKDKMKVGAVAGAVLSVIGLCVALMEIHGQLIMGLVYLATQALSTSIQVNRNLLWQGLI